MPAYASWVAAAVVIVAALPIAPSRDGQQVRALLIGNSLTQTNDLPGMIEGIADAAGARGSVKCAIVAFPNFGLPDHWNHGEALRMIRRGGWTHVVLQQGPSSLDESRRVLIEYVRKFAPEIRATGAQVVLFGVWPPASRAAFLDAVTASYAAAADDVGGVLVPVGEGWKRAWHQDSTLGLYGPDGFHPSPLGSYVASLMMYEALSGRSTLGLPPPARSRHRTLRSIALAEEQLAIVQNAAAGANRTNARR